MSTEEMRSALAAASSLEGLAKRNGDLGERIERLEKAHLELQQSVLNIQKQVLEAIDLIARLKKLTLGDGR